MDFDTECLEHQTLIVGNWEIINGFIQAEDESLWLQQRAGNASPGRRISYYTTGFEEIWNGGRTVALLWQT